jgi:hypothetical protein
MNFQIPQKQGLPSSAELTYLTPTEDRITRIVSLLYRSHAILVETGKYVLRFYMKVKVNGHLGDSGTDGSSRNQTSEFASAWVEVEGACLYFQWII